MISWSYYGEQCWAHLFGVRSLIVYQGLFLAFVWAGSVFQAKAVLDFSDLMLFGMAFPNVFGLVVMSGRIKRELALYLRKLRQGELERPRACRSDRLTPARPRVGIALMNKQGVLVLWVVVIVAGALGSGWVATVGQLLFWLLVATHVAEFFLKRSVLEAAGGSMGHHFVQTLVYGMFHWKPLEEAQAGGGSAD